MDNKRISEIVDEEMIKQDANRYRDMRKILTIPKSIADELDEIYENHIDTHEDVTLVFHYMKLYPIGTYSNTYSNAKKWFNTDNDSTIRSHSNTNIALAYLAGKALGVDLVKVVEG